MRALNFWSAGCCLLVAASAMASVTFAPATGTGFVGKGDVQLALGWNNATLQANASSLTFSYVSTDTYTAVCTWITGEGTRGEKTHNVAHSSTSGVASTIAYDTRVRTQITGFNLVGLTGTAVAEGEVPVPGARCPGGSDGTWTSVSLTSSVNQLNVNFGSVSVKIWPPLSP